jgi:GAF domain-containing protein
MATATVLDASRTTDLLRRAAARGAGRGELLELTARAIREAGPPYTSAYLYMLHGDELVLEAHSGRDTEHLRIPVGRGVCGTAVAERRDQNVPDVSAIGNYLACNAFTRSELVVLIERNGTILGQIDIDSDVPAGFSPAEHAAVREVADALAELL